MPIWAAEQFTSQLQSTYTVDESGNTRVVHQISITNKTPAVFIKQYALKTNSGDIKSVLATYKNSPLAPNVVSTPTATTIALDFPDQVVGEGKSRVFTIEYLTNDLATIGGRVLEFHAPKLGTAQAFDQLTTVIQTPLKFGAPKRAEPTPTSTQTTTEHTITTFAGEQASGVTLFFGDTQYYGANTRYQLENTGSSEAVGQIALPPDTQFQKVSYESLSPLPATLKRDPDGNWIATYRIPANSITTVDLMATITVTLERNNTPGQTVLKEHLSTQPFWQVQNPTITNLAQQNPTASNIYNYLIKTLTYADVTQTQKLHRLGAVDALANPDQAVCQEFTDTFVTIARAAGIPARRLTGFAYTQNEKLRPLGLEGDVLHAWPEYYDAASGNWQPIDPTWGATTGGVDYFNQFDLNHIVFAINGVSSTTPYAAGFYKAQDSTTKDVQITFTQAPPELPNEYHIRISSQQLFGLPVPGLSILTLTNNSGTAVYDLNLTVGNVVRQIDALLPFESRAVPITLLTETWSLPRAERATVTIRDSAGQIVYESTNHTIISAPPIFGRLTNPTVLLGVGISIAVTTLTAGSVLVFRRKQHRFIRRKS